jgi:hypothetical protein
MAFKKTVITVHGFEAVDAYHRVEGVRLISKEIIAFQVRLYKTADFAHFDDKQYECNFSLQGKNPLAQAYEHLKTLPEFADASDC